MGKKNKRVIEQNVLVSVGGKKKRETNGINEYKINFENKNEPQVACKNSVPFRPLIIASCVAIERVENRWKLIL